MVLKRKIYWAIAIALVVPAAVGIVFGWIGCDRAIHPPLGKSPYNTSQFDLPLEDVHFQSRDGLRLAGWFIPGTNGATVILAHGRGSERSRMLPHANYLHKDGFSVLMFDFRYRGQSEGDESTMGAKEPWDIEGAVDYLKTRSDVDSERVGVQGSSLGAVSAILASAETPEIKGVVAEIPFKDLPSTIAHAYEHPSEGVGLPSFPFAPVSKCFCEFRLGVDLDEVSPVKVIAQISPRPIFLIDDLEDDVFPSDSVEVLYEAAREPKELWSIPEATHSTRGGWETAPEEYERRVLAFWQQTFGVTHEAASF